MDSKRKVYIAIIIFTVINLLFIFLLIFPSLKKIKNNSQELFNQRIDFTYLKEEISNLRLIKDKKDIISADLEKINNLFVDPEIPVDFINFLEREAFSSQLSIDVSPINNPKKESVPWSSLFFQITVRGPFPKFLEFLDKIENSSYLVEIINLDLRRDTEKKEIEKKEVQIDIVNAAFEIKVFTR